MERFVHISVMRRIFLMLTAFGLSLALLLGSNYCQNLLVLKPLERQSDNIYAISRFLTCVETSLKSLSEFRWDYGDADSLLAELDRQQRDAELYLDDIETDLSLVREEQHLLARAVHTTHSTFARSMNELKENLRNEHRDGALAEYYSRTQPCGSYLLQYTQQLLELAIAENQQAFVQTIRIKDRLQKLQFLVVVITIPLGIALVLLIRQVLGPVQQMAQASQEIARGNFDVPDVVVPRQDEIGRLAGAFNEMKYSMKNQVKLLNEKNAMERDLHRHQTRALEMQTLIEREKMQQLRSQISPHFLFNTLNVIRYTAGQENAPRTRTLLTSLSGLLRYSLASNDELVPISNEVRIIDNLFLLYHVRFGDRIRLEWRISPHIDLTETMMPSFLLQPLVENAFRHGLFPKEEGGLVRICITSREQRLYLSVSDDGVGMTAEQRERLRTGMEQQPTGGEHIGMYNVAARVRLLGKGYSMEVHSRPGRGVQVILRMPLMIRAEEDEDA